MDIIKQHLNPSCVSPASLNFIFWPLGLSKQIGDVLKCIWGSFCIEVVREMAKTIVQSVRSKHFTIFTPSGLLLPALRGKQISETHTHPNKNIGPSFTGQFVKQCFGPAGPEIRSRWGQIRKYNMGPQQKV